MLAAPPQVELRPAQPRLGYRPALDGVRALAVAAVFAYHAHLGWAKAGFLGVDVFFVLSGYLITALLLTERRREGRIDLARFWAARARRLLPPLIVVLAAVAVAVPLLAAEQAGRLRGDLLAALGYVSNWRLVFEHQSYFEAAGRPPVLQHLWSLAVEEQFYLLWPPVLWFALRRKPHRRLVRPLLLAAAASAVLMAVLYQPFSDPSRVYYGTDTRAAALLVGAALACATTRWQLVGWVPRSGRVALEVGGVASLAALAWAVSQATEYDPRLYRGGFLAVALAAAGLVAACARPGRPAVLGRVLGSRPMVWVGRRSYAIYLWFWPVLMLTRAHYDVPFGGLGLLALQTGLTLVLAALSYRLIERPVLDGALGRMRQALRTRRAGVRVGAEGVRGALVGAALAAAVAAIAVGVVMGHAGRPPDSVLAQAPGLNSSLAPAVADPPGADAPAPPVETPGTAPATARRVLGAPVTAIGDSVMLGAKVLLEQQVEGITVDASVARQIPNVLATVRAYRDSGRLADNVILHTGNNGVITTSQFEQVMEALRDVPLVVVVNVKVARGYQDLNNSVLEGVTARYRNAVLVDWRAVAGDDHEAFYDDGIHLTPHGQRLYVQAVLSLF